jgi:hypothetical protein
MIPCFILFRSFRNNTLLPANSSVVEGGRLSHLEFLLPVAAADLVTHGEGWPLIHLHQVLLSPVAAAGRSTW